MTIYKYHIYLYKLYQKFGDSAWCSGEAEKIMKPTMHSYLHKKRYISWIRRPEAEEKRPELKEWHRANWQFHCFSQQGLELAQKIKREPNLIAKKLLTDGGVF